MHYEQQAEKKSPVSIDQNKLSLNNVTNSEAFPGLIRQAHRKIRTAAADGAYDTRFCHDELRRKKISALILPEKELVTGQVSTQAATVLLRTSD